MQKISQSEYQHSQQLTTATWHIYSDHFKQFYDQRVFTSRNSKRRIIRVDGSSICLNQLSFHFRNMSRSSRGRVYRPWWLTRLRLTSKVNRWLHKSCASSATQDHEIKTILTNVQMTCAITSISQLNATLPCQNSGPTWLLVGRNSSDFD